MRSFALGFVHAQDRLWQMEMSRARRRRPRSPKSSARAALESDRFLRTLGVRRSREANLARCDADTRRSCSSAYAAGVNAFSPPIRCCRRSSGSPALHAGALDRRPTRSAG